MRTKLRSEELGGDTIETIKNISGENVYKCYQCGKCSAACPAAEEMDMIPSQVIRYLQLGMHEVVLESKTPWVCASCLQCMSVCPKGVDLAKIMEALRTVQLRLGKNRIDMKAFDEDYRKRAPQIALISGFRKFLSLS